jgi:hypothetical protein
MPTNTTIQLTLATFGYAGSDLGMPISRVLQLSGQPFTLTGFNLTGAFIGRMAQLTTGFFSTVFYSAVMDAFPIPETPATEAPVAEEDASAGATDITGRAPTWRRPGSATGGTAWRTPLTFGGPWRRG